MNERKAMNSKITTMVAVACFALLTGCSQPDYQPDQAKREELFFHCMQALPRGPDKTVYNDWDEVITECGSQAYQMAMHCVKNCAG